MTFTTINNVVTGNSINEAVFVGDSSRPASCKLMLQKLRFAMSFKCVSFYIFKQFSYFLKNFDIINRPVVIIVKGFCFKNKSFQHFLLLFNPGNICANLFFFRIRLQKAHFPDNLFNYFPYVNHTLKICLNKQLTFNI